jgi:radical SAM superfamily enzyme YgiQ (UPF0313 family)
MHGLLLTGFMAQQDIASYRRTAGGHRIATHLRQQGWDIEVLDFVMGWTLDQLKEFTKSRANSNTKFIGFGGTFPIWSNTLLDYFKWVKETYPSIILIAGGQISNLYKIKADWYINGFGERALDALLQHLAGTGTEKLKYQLWADGRKIIKGNLDYPAYPMKSLKIKYEDRDFILSNETLVTELGRGCIFNCKFCNFPILGIKEDHSRDADDLYEELQDTYDRFGVTQYHIADETVNDYTTKLEKFAGAIRRLNFKPTFTGFARADLLVSRKQDWDIMLEMGFIAHHYGIESTNHESLKVVGKGMNPEKLLPGLIEVKNYFKKNNNGIYKGQVSLIAGLPYETNKSFDATINWFKHNWTTENVLVFPLYIPKDDGGDVKSKFSDEWEKYGYRETERNLFPIIKRYYGSLPTQYGVNDILLDHTGISWENDEWNVADVYKKVMDFYQDPSSSKTFGPISWSVGDYVTAFNKPYEFFIGKTIHQIQESLINTDLSGKNGQGYNMILTVLHEQQLLIQNYIKKKLDWKPK